jgi:tRNA threonylcarbamoyladenosine biosynthesis protein TsaB
LSPGAPRFATILGLDTTTRIASVGLLRDGIRVAGRDEDRPRGHVASLPALVDAVFAEGGCRSGDLDAIAVAVGPGSFTGIRVGLGFAKGLAYAHGIAVVGVGTLDALAEAAPDDGSAVATCLDARKGEVYLAFYSERDGPSGRHRIGAIEALPPDEAARRIAAAYAGRSGIVVGDGPSVYPSDFTSLERGGLRCFPFEEAHPSGAAVAEIGARRLASGAGQSPEEVHAVYVRPSAAEARRAAREPR